MSAASEIERGRSAYAERSWADAHSALVGADEASPLEVEDLERLATSAYMIGDEEQYLATLERIHQIHQEAGEGLRAAHSALWVGLTLASHGEMGRASGWLARAGRLVEGEGTECVEQGYLLLPRMFELEAAGEFEGAVAVAAEAAAIGERFGDRDLFALAVHSQGHLACVGGDPGGGVKLLDEAMVAATTGELSPIVTGIVYCGVILGCQAAYELGRAREWTAALTSWCEQQPDMVAFTGRCLVHRAEIMQLHGAWPDALEEARRAAERCAEASNEAAAAEATYRQAEVHRLRGETAAAERAYREASKGGREPQPGLALLRLSQGKQEAAAAAIRRALGETKQMPTRAALLAAAVEILIAAEAPEEAGAAAEELDAIAQVHDSDMLNAMAAGAAGTVELAAGRAREALVELRRCWQAWQELEARYEAARARVMVGRACRALGDDDTAGLELDAAREAFAALGATPDESAVAILIGGRSPTDAHGLTARELEVLRLVAAGATNKAIATELVLSERTVDRHVSNIFAKLGVSSRAAATAFAYEHELL